MLFLFFLIGVHHKCSWFPSAAHRERACKYFGGRRSSFNTEAVDKRPARPLVRHEFIGGYETTAAEPWPETRGHGAMANQGPQDSPALRSPATSKNRPCIRSSVIDESETTSNC